MSFLWSLFVANSCQEGWRFGAGKCGLGGFCEDRGRRAAAAFQISRAPKLPAFRPECVVVHGVSMLDL